MAVDDDVADEKLKARSERFVHEFVKQQTDHANVPIVGQIFAHSSKEITLSPGAKAPEFSLVSMEDPQVTYTAASFEGKTVLLDCPLRLIWLAILMMAHGQ